MSLDLWLYVKARTGHENSDDDGLEYVRVCHAMNVTHNVVPMWERAGIYDALYKNDGRRAGDVLPALVNALADMRSNMDEYTKLDPENGWGDSRVAYRFLHGWIERCEARPDALIGLSS